MAGLFDNPERLLSRSLIGIADAPGGDPPCQLCASSQTSETFFFSRPSYPSGDHGLQRGLGYQRGVK